MPRYPRQANRGSLCQFQPRLFACEDDTPERSTVPPQPTESASGSSTDEDVPLRSPPNRCQQEKSSATFSISTLALRRYLLS